LRPRQVVVRQDGRLELAMLCACGKTALLLRAVVTDRRLVVVDAQARTGALSAEDMELLADGLLQIVGRVHAWLPAAKRRRRKEAPGGQAQGG
jgi:hypothetical protein